MVDEDWFDPAQPEQAPAALTAPIPAINPVLSEHRAIGPAECPESTSCANCGRPLYAGMLVRPAHDTHEVPYDCLTCWWKIEMERVKALAQMRAFSRAVAR